MRRWCAVSGGVDEAIDGRHHLTNPFRCSFERLSPGWAAVELKSLIRIHWKRRKESAVKALLGILAGLVVSLGMFAGGLAAAIYFLAIEPPRELNTTADVGELWSAQPRRVKTTAQALERVPDATVSPQPGPSAAIREAGKQSESALEPRSIDAITTGAVPDVGVRDRKQQKPAPAMSEAHLKWCASRYRSYRPSDNSYTPYSGGRRQCVSPYQRNTATAATPTAPPLDGSEYAENDEDPSFFPLEYVSTDAQEGTDFTSQHVRYCFSRYRSYRPEDNTYQPYGGGPRKECQ
jgi:hypothetical protein